MNRSNRDLLTSIAVAAPVLIPESDMLEIESKLARWIVEGDGEWKQ